jgi:hypothetical protein
MTSGPGPSIEECRALAAEYKKLASDPNNSGRTSSVLKNISNSWTALAHQLQALAAITKAKE